MKNSPTVIAIQIFRIFCMGQALPPGNDTKDIKEIKSDNTNGVAAEFTKILSKNLSILFFEFSPFSIFREDDKIFVKAACISAFENKEHTAAFQNNVRAEINSRNAGPSCC